MKAFQNKFDIFNTVFVFAKLSKKLYFVYGALRPKLISVWSEENFIRKTAECFKELFCLRMVV